MSTPQEITPQEAEGGTRHLHELGKVPAVEHTRGLHEVAALQVELGPDGRTPMAEYREKVRQTRREEERALAQEKGKDQQREGIAYEHLKAEFEKVMTAGQGEMFVDAIEEIILCINRNRNTPEALKAYFKSGNDNPLAPRAITEAGAVRDPEELSEEFFQEYIEALKQAVDEFIASSPKPEDPRELYIVKYPDLDAVYTAHPILMNFPQITTNHLAYGREQGPGYTAYLDLSKESICQEIDRHETGEPPVPFKMGANFELEATIGKEKIQTTKQMREALKNGDIPHAWSLATKDVALSKKRDLVKDTETKIAEDAPELTTIDNEWQPPLSGRREASLNMYNLNIRNAQDTAILFMKDRVKKLQALRRELIDKSKGRHQLSNLAAEIWHADLERSDDGKTNAWPLPQLSQEVIRQTRGLQAADKHEEAITVLFEELYNHDPRKPQQQAEPEDNSLGARFKRWWHGK